MIRLSHIYRSRIITVSHKTKLDGISTRKVILKGTAKRGKFKSKNKRGDNENLQHVVFPILRQEKDGKFNLVGTGFFICDNGIFISAKHVFTDVIDDNGQCIKPLVIFHFLPDNIYIIRSIERSIVNNRADVGVGILKPLIHKKTKQPLKNNILTLTTKAPEIGEEVVTYAYPNILIDNKNSKQDIHFYPDYYDGTLVKYYANGRDKTFLPNPCYQTNMVIHGGASGGPVFGLKGKVFGVNSTGFFNDNISFVSRINEILNIQIYPVTINGQKPINITIGELAELGHVILDR